MDFLFHLIQLFTVNARLSKPIETHDAPERISAVSRKFESVPKSFSSATPMVKKSSAINRPNVSRILGYRLPRDFKALTFMRSSSGVDLRHYRKLSQ